VTCFHKGVGGRPLARRLAGSGQAGGRPYNGDLVARGISILGCTGFIGRQALDVIRASPERFKPVALAACSNVEVLAEQAAAVKPSLAVIFDTARENELERRLAGTGVRVMSGMEGLVSAATCDEAEVVLLAMSGTEGLTPLLAAVRARKTVALANKESLVAAGHIVMSEARQAGATIVPVDSEHSAVFQALWQRNGASVARIILTASGGALRDLPPEALDDVTVEQALAHPTWRMSPKVTVDSATLMNKGLEVIEAHWLFGVEVDRIEVVLQRESMVHSLVEFVDGSCLGQMCPPDMRVPIQYALGFPEHVSQPWAPVDWKKPFALHFEPVDRRRYPCLDIACQAGKLGGTFPAAMVGADEEAVSLFLAGKIRFGDIPKLISIALEQHRSVPDASVAQVAAALQDGRDCVKRQVERRVG